MMNNLMADILAGRVSVVIAKDRARIARDFRLFGEWAALLKNHGVALIFMSEGPL